MKKSQFAVLICCLFAATLFYSCFKDGKLSIPSSQPVADVLPPITQEGKNTFGCLLNGKVWLAHSYNQPSKSIQVEYYKKAFQLAVLRQDALFGPYQGLTIGVVDKIIYEGASVDLNMFSNHGALFGDDAGCGEFMIKPGYAGGGGKLNITKLDTVKRIISGTFYITFYKSGCKDTIKMTDGRFDYIYTN